MNSRYPAVTAASRPRWTLSEPVTVAFESRAPPVSDTTPTRDAGAATPATTQHMYITTLRPKSACGLLGAISIHVRNLRYGRGIESKDAAVTR